MKKNILLTIATMLATISFAQQQLATLNHNDSITVYYGSSALDSAHAAAVNGDVITLSPGRFGTYQITITKAITIRGAGMLRDTLGNLPTEITCDVYMHVPNDSLNHLTLEGLCFNSALIWKKLYNPRIIKCRAKQGFSYNTSSSLMTNAQIINCIIGGFGFSTGYQSNTQLINSVIDGLGGDAVSLINCIAYTGLSSLSNMYIMNSIVYYDDCGSHNATTSYYSIGINSNNDNYYNCYFFDTVYTPDHNLHNFNDFSSVFKTFRGEESSYNEGETYELQDSIANTILGDDGTQVGIYGGPFPFNPNVRNPRIKRCSVAQRSTADNKLAVDIEVVSE